MAETTQQRDAPGNSQQRHEILDRRPDIHPGDECYTELLEMMQHVARKSASDRQQSSRASENAIRLKEYVHKNEKHPSLGPIFTLLVRTIVDYQVSIGRDTDRAPDHFAESRCAHPVRDSV